MLSDEKGGICCESSVSKYLYALIILILIVAVKGVSLRPMPRSSSSSSISLQRISTILRDASISSSCNLSGHGFTFSCLPFSRRFQRGHSFPPPGGPPPAHTISQEVGASV